MGIDDGYVHQARAVRNAERLAVGVLAISTSNKGRPEISMLS
jgi:hypothetical protein